MSIDLIIDQSLFEAISYPGVVGIDLELLVRTDVVGHFEDFLAAKRWGVDTDASVSVTFGTLEAAFYTPLEIKSLDPKQASELFADLAMILAWLKHEDLVFYSTKTKDVHGVVKPKDISPKLSKASFNKFGFDRRLKLARGRSPMNLSAGCHLHFDIKQWFTSGDHMERFMDLFMNHQDKIKGQIIHGRFNAPPGQASPGYTYARFKDPTKYDDRPSDPIRRGYSLMGSEKHQALSMYFANSRGDIEVRVFHSTLNLATIIHWFDLVAKMIDYTVLGRRRPDWDAFQSNLYSTEPKLQRDFTSRAKHNRKYPFPGRTDVGHPTFEPLAATAAVSKILGGRSGKKNRLQVAKT